MPMIPCGRNVCTERCRDRKHDVLFITVLEPGTRQGAMSNACAIPVLSDTRLLDCSGNHQRSASGLRTQARPDEMSLSKCHTRGAKLTGRPCTVIDGVIIINLAAGYVTTASPDSSCTPVFSPRFLLMLCRRKIACEPWSLGVLGVKWYSSLDRRTRLLAIEYWVWGKIKKKKSHYSIRKFVLFRNNNIIIL